MALATGFAASAANTQDPEVVRERLDALRERMATLQSEMQADTRRRDSLAGDLADAERRLGEIAGAVRELNAQLDGVHRQLGDLETERRDLDASLAAQRDRLGASVRSAYLMGREQRLKLLLNQQDVAAAGRVMAYYQYLHRARIEHIGRVRDELARLAAVEQGIAERRDRLASLRDEKAAELERERAALADRRRVLASIRARIDERGDTLSALERDEQSLEKLLEEIEQALADIPARLDRPFGDLRGRLAWPVAGHDGVRSEDDGVLIRAEAGARVLAVAPGRVAYADWLRGYGLLVIVEHGDGYMSLYAHNHTLYKDVGDWVEGGEALGEVGDSGGRERAALYFELRKGGEPIRATAWLQAD